jgi:hypothetical protein
MQTVARGLERVRQWGQALGPYLMLEIVLPGGTLFALLLWLYRRSQLGVRLGEGLMLAKWSRALSRMAGQTFALQPAYLRPSQAFRSDVRRGRHRATCSGESRARR